MMNRKYTHMPAPYNRGVGYGVSRDNFRNSRVNDAPLSNRSVRETTCGCGRSAPSTPPVVSHDLHLPLVEDGCGCGCGHHQHNDCAKLLKQIQTVDFALYEVILYLDAYPEHCEALDLYHKLSDRRRMLASAYEESCGPLTAWNNVSKTSWDWVKTPAPWEYPND